MTSEANPEITEIKSLIITNDNYEEYKDKLSSQTEKLIVESINLSEKSFKITKMLNTKYQKCSSDITFSGNKYNYTKDINIDKTNKHISDKCNCAKVFYIEYSKPINEIIK